MIKFITFILALFLSINSTENINDKTEFIDRDTDWFSIKVPKNWEILSTESNRRMRQLFPRETMFGTQIWQDYYVKHFDEESNISFSFEIFEYDKNNYKEFLNRNTAASEYYDILEIEEFKNDTLNGYKVIVIAGAKGPSGENPETISYHYLTRWVVKGEKYFYLFTFQTQLENKSLFDRYRQFGYTMMESFREK